MTMLEQLQKGLDQRKIDGLFVSQPSNVFALTGFRSSNAYALVTGGAAYLFTDPRYLEKAQALVTADWRVMDMTAGLLDQVQTCAAKHRLKRIGFEAKHVTVLLHKRLQSLSSVEWKETVDVVELLRMVKSPHELKCLRQAQRLNEESLKIALGQIRPGMTEVQVAWLIQCAGHDLGADGMAFPPIVAFGAHTARPHHEPTNKKLKRGDMILLDMGVTYKAYASDLTRTFFSKTPTSEQGDVYQTVLAAHQAAVLAAKPGATSDDVDRAARLLISDSGYKGKFGHATGHGVGLDIHELPRLAKGDTTELAAGQVVAIEPGIYLPKKFGVRLEDMVEITATGHKSLNHVPKDLSFARLKV